MASLTRWTWVSVNAGSWWWTGRPGVLWFMGSQRVGHDWATDLIWSDAYGNSPLLGTACNELKRTAYLDCFQRPAVEAEVRISINCKYKFPDTEKRITVTMSLWKLVCSIPLSRVDFQRVAINAAGSWSAVSTNIQLDGSTVSVTSWFLWSYCGCMREYPL